MPSKPTPAPKTEVNEKGEETHNGLTLQETVDKFVDKRPLTEEEKAYALTLPQILKPASPLLDAINRLNPADLFVVQKLVLAVGLINENFMKNHKCDDGRQGGCTYHYRGNEAQGLLDSIVVVED